ncbi:MAG: hypothetical protein AAF604_23015 [Acidobacteriota bacterium]
MPRRSAVTIAALVVASLGLSTGRAWAALEVTVDESANGVRVLFDQPVLVESVKPSGVTAYALRRDPLPEVVPLRVVEISPIEGDRLDEVFVLRFAAIDERPALVDRRAEFTLVFDGVRTAKGRKLGRQQVSFRRFPTPAWSIDESLGRRTLEIHDLVRSAEPIVPRDWLERQAAKSRPDLALEWSSARPGVARPLAVERLEIDGPHLRLFLARALPKGKPIYLRLTLPSTDEGDEVVIANRSPFTFSAPLGRSDSSLAYYLDLAFVSEGGADERDDEGLLDLVVRPGPWSFADSGEGPWVRRWRPLLEAQVGSDSGVESRMPDRVTLGADLLFDRATARWGEHRLRAGLRHHADRDFDHREGLAELAWSPVADAWVRTVDQRRRDFDRRPVKARLGPLLRSWAFVPILGVEAGEVLAADPGVEKDSFVRAWAGFELDLAVGPFSLAVNEKLRRLDSGDEEWRNLLAATLSYQLTPTQGIGLKLQKGYDAPTFAEVDVVSVAYRIQY